MTEAELKKLLELSRNNPFHEGEIAKTEPFQKVVRRYKEQIDKLEKRLDEEGQGLLWDVVLLSELMQEYYAVHWLQVGRQSEKEEESADFS